MDLKNFIVLPNYFSLPYSLLLILTKDYIWEKISEMRKAKYNFMLLEVNLSLRLIQMNRERYQV